MRLYFINVQRVTLFPGLILTSKNLCDQEIFIKRGQKGIILGSIGISINRREIKSIYEIHKSAYYQTKIKEVSQAKDVKKTWKLINNLIGKGGKSTNIA